MLPLNETSPGSGNQRAVYVGDRYEPYIGTKEGSRYIWLPMEITPGGGLILFNVSEWSLQQWPTLDEDDARVWAWEPAQEAPVAVPVGVAQKVGAPAMQAPKVEVPTLEAPMVEARL